MNITREEIDALNAKVKIEIQQDDYQTRVEEVLKDYRKKVKLDGFRPGKVPPGLIRKMYGKAILIEEINKIISESLSKYISEEKLNILGEPLPTDEKQEPVDWDNQKEFEFVFDLGLTPQIEVNLTAKDKVPYYTISIDKKIKDSYKEEYTKKMGSFQPVDRVEDDAMLKGKIIQLDVHGEIVETGIQVEETSFTLVAVKDEAIRKIFKGKHVNDTIDFNIKKAIPNDTEIASILQIDKDQVPDIHPDFRFTIQEISRFENAEINQEFFDKAFGEGNVTSEKEFEEKIEEEIGAHLSKESEMRFTIDAKEKIIKKLKIELPSSFLKRWLFTINEGKVTEEQIDKDFDHFEQDLKWQLIKDKIIKDNEITVTNEEIEDYARDYARMQFQQYGMANIPEEYLNNYAKEILGKEEEAKKIYGMKYEQKVIEYIRDKVKLDMKKITSAEFNKLYEKK